MMRRRKAETLVEFLMASVVFVEIMAGVLTFIANQTETLVNISNRDTMMFHAQRYMNMGVSYSDYNGDALCVKDNVNFSKDDNGNLIISKGKSTMKFELMN